MAEMLTESQKHDFTKAFSLFDYDKDGIISNDDMRIVLKSLGHKISDHDLDELIKSIDRNGDGKIELTEFLDIMGTKQQSVKALEEEVKIAFDFFDLDGNGFISVMELKQVASELGEELTESEIDEMIREADSDGDGQVNYNEFLRMMMYDGTGLS